MAKWHQSWRKFSQQGTPGVGRTARAINARYIEAGGIAQSREEGSDPNGVTVFAGACKAEDMDSEEQGGGRGTGTREDRNHLRSTPGLAVHQQARVRNNG